jgi:ferritin-like metal-binding protein YciE
MAKTKVAERPGQVIDEQFQELLYQALETEIGGQQVYESAINCAQNPDLKEEWQKYLEETQTHEQVLLATFQRIGLDSGNETPGRAVLRHKAQGLVQAMEMALEQGGPVAAQLVAAECVVEAETKDHQNWELIGKLSETLDGETAAALAEAHAQVEEQEDQHLYHTMGWARELWIESLGMPAVLPPPEEEKQVTTAIGAARAKQSREKML